jgi:hypothetical protein
MMTFFASIWEWVKWAFSALIPFKPGGGLSPAVRWFIWIVLDVAFLVLLWFINWYANLAPVVQRMPFHLAERAPWLRDFFLPILGQLIVLMGVVLYWFYRLWFVEPEDSQFPDIDAAWQEVTQALTRAGVQLPQLPLFLLIGRPEAAEEHLFEASGLKPLVKQIPANPRAPVHVFADRDAVYVTCRGASVLGKLADILALEDGQNAAAADDDDAEDLEKTMRPGSREQAITETIRGSAGLEAAPLGKRAGRRLAMGKPLGMDFMSDFKAVEICKARLAHLCRLIVRDRQPFCPANGVVLLVPFAGTDTLYEAQLVAQAAEEDLRVVRQEMKLDCPVVSMLVDMEQLPGFAEFMKKQSAKELGNRLGSGFPMATRLSRDEMLQHIRQSLTWVCTTYLQDSVYRSFRSETPADNARLVLLLAEMNERADSLSMIVQQAVAPQNDTLLRYAGCYMAATGPKGNQGFVAGVFQKLVKEQSSVTWTQAALTQDAQCRTWASYYFLLALLLFVVGVALLAVIIYRMASS